MKRQFKSALLLTQHRESKLIHALALNKANTFKAILPAIAFTLSLIAAAFNTSAQGYIYVHNKTLNEESSVDFSFKLTNTVTNASKTCSLNDNPNYLLLGDLGAGHTAATTGAINADGELWAIGATTACCMLPADVTGAIYRRAAGTSAWVKATSVTATAVDGAFANQCVYATSAGIYFYNNGTSTQLYSGSGIKDVTTGGGNIAAIFNDGSIRTYTISASNLNPLKYSEGSAPAAGGNWQKLTGTSADKLDMKKDGTTILSMKNYSVSTILFGGGGGAAVGTDVPGTGYTDSRDVAYDDNGIIYAIGSGGSAGSTPTVFNRLSNTWTEERRSQNTSCITGGAGGQVWALYGSNNYSGSYVNSILARTTSQNAVAYGAGAVWYDDERVHTATEGNAFAGTSRTATGNSIMMPVAAGTYTLTQTNPDATWDIRRINIYDPTGNSTSTISTGITSINVAANEIVTVEYVNEKLANVIVPNLCGTNTVESFGSGAAAYGSPLQGTAYHYLNRTSPEDGDYMVVKSVTSSNWFKANTITNHSGDANGYFMMVNASYAQDEFYRKRVTGLAVGQLYTLSFWAASISDGVPGNVAFGIQDLNGNNMGITNTGDITPNSTAATWKQYSFTFTATAANADIYLSNNSIGGDGNDIAIDDIAFNIAAPSNPVPTATSKTASCPFNTVNLVSLQPAAIAGQTYEWHTASTNPTTANLIGDPSAAAPGATYYLFSVLTGTGCYSGSTGSVSTTATICPAAITGKVWNDANNDKVINLNEAGTNTGSGTLYVYLVNTTGTIIDRATVAADGTYSLTGVVNTDYKLQLSNTAYSVLSKPATFALTLPTNWVTTGENISGNNTGSGDGTADGIIATFNSGNAGKSNMNFGIEQLPTAGAGANSAVNPGGTISVIVPANTFSNTTLSSDPTPGNVASIRITTFPANTTSITINNVKYTSADLAALQALTIPTDASGNPTVAITLDPVSNGNSVISFVAKDNAGKESSNTGTAIMTFADKVAISGNVFNDANGNTVKDAGETTANTSAPLYVYLVDGKGNISDSAKVAIDGTYTVDGIANTAYALQLSNVSYPIGNSTAANPVSTVAATGWATTGENAGGNNTGTGDGSADGKMTINTGSAGKSNINFGLEQLPVAGDGENYAVNPGGTISVPVPANTFTNDTLSSDFAPGTVSSIRITEFPDNATSITIGSKTYYAATPADVTALLALTIPTDASGNPTVSISIDPSEEGTVLSEIHFVAKDNAGKESANIGTATMDFDDGITVSGSIIDDANGNTIKDASENLVNTGSQLYVYLIDAQGNIADVATVKADGTYSLSALPSSAYTLVLSGIVYKEGANIATDPINTAPSTGWAATGENGNGARDAVGDGMLTLNTGTANITAQNFGIEALPFTDSKAFNVSKYAYSGKPQTGYPAISGYTSILASSTALTGYNNTGGKLTGSDAEDCVSTTTANSCNAGKTFTIQSINSNTKLYYNFGSGPVEITIAGTSIPNFDATKLVIYGRDGSGTAASPVGFTYKLVDAAGNPSTAPGTYSIASSSPLPLDLLRFDAVKEASRVRIAWATANEINTSGFDVLHSTDGKSWNVLAIVIASGKSADDYEVYHHTPANGKNFYRLKMMDNNGAYTLSEVRTVIIDQQEQLSVYPNPVINTLHIATNDLGNISDLILMDASGKIIRTITSPASADIDVADIPAGVYSLKVINKDASSSTFKIRK